MAAWIVRAVCLFGILALMVCPGGTVWAAAGDCETVAGKTDTAITSIMGVAGTGVATIMGKNYTDGDGGAAFSDAFAGNLDSWTAVDGSWSIVSGALSSDTGGGAISIILHETQCTTQNQYVRAKINAIGSGVVLRGNDLVDASPRYIIVLKTYGDTMWNGSAPGASEWEQIDIGTWTAGDVIGVTVTGSGADTIIRVWQNPTNNTPAAIDGWDTALDTADATFTATPTTEASGTYLGFITEQATGGASTFDDFYGGDVP